VYLSSGPYIRCSVLYSFLPPGESLTNENQGKLVWKSVGIPTDRPVRCVVDRNLSTKTTAAASSFSFRFPLHAETKFASVVVVSAVNLWKAE
jgi:hypothetical protein